MYFEYSTLEDLSSGTVDDWIKANEAFLEGKTAILNRSNRRTGGSSSRIFLDEWAIGHRETKEIDPKKLNDRDYISILQVKTLNAIINQPRSG